MKYFVGVNDLKGTVYHEFQKGTFNGKTFWKDDSIYIHDDLLCTLGLSDIFASVIPQYSYTGVTEVNQEQWKKIMHKALLIGGKTKECIIEADEWVKVTFEEYDVFTILGI